MYAIRSYYGLSDEIHVLRSETKSDINWILQEVVAARDTANAALNKAGQCENRLNNSYNFV